MIREKKTEEKPEEESVNEEITLADIVENEEDKKILEPVKEETVKSDFIIGITTKDGVMLRKDPDENGQVLYVLKKDEGVVINHDFDTSKFYFVSAKSALGYILKDEITIV